MGASTVQTYLIAYDIREPRRLGRVHRYMRKHAVPVQYSVFIGRFSRAEVRALAEGLEEIIDTARDDVRIYPLPARCEAVTLGPGVFPDGVLLADPGLALLA